MFTVNRNWPLWLISTQHGAVWSSAKGLAPIDVSAPLNPTLKAEMVPVPAPTLWALETNSCWGSVGRNSLPKRPEPLGGGRGPGSGGQEPASPHDEAVDQRRADPGAYQVVTGRVEEHIAGLGTVGKGNRRVGQRLQLPEEGSV